MKILFSILLLIIFNLNAKSQNIEDYKKRIGLDVHTSLAGSEFSSGLLKTGIQLTLSKYFSDYFSSGIFYYYGPNGHTGDRTFLTYFRVYNEIGVSGKVRVPIGSGNKTLNLKSNFTFFVSAGIAYMFAEYQNSDVKEETGISLPIYTGFEYYFSKHFGFGFHIQNRITKYTPGGGIGIQFIIIT